MPVLLFCTFENMQYAMHVMILHQETGFSVIYVTHGITKDAKLIAIAITGFATYAYVQHLPLRSVTFHDSLGFMIRMTYIHDS